jgi:hypothetical protein
VKELAGVDELAGTVKELAGAIHIIGMEFTLI